MAGYLSSAHVSKIIKSIRKLIETFNKMPVKFIFYTDVVKDEIYDEVLDAVKVEKIVNCIFLDKTATSSFSVNDYMIFGPQIDTDALIVISEEGLTKFPFIDKNNIETFNTFKQLDIIIEDQEYVVKKCTSYGHQLKKDFFVGFLYINRKRLPSL